MTTRSTPARDDGHLNGSFTVRDDAVTDGGITAPEIAAFSDDVATFASPVSDESILEAHGDRAAPGRATVSACRR